MAEYTNHVEMNSDLMRTGSITNDGTSFVFIPMTGTDSGTVPPTYSSSPVINDGGGGDPGGTVVTGADAQSWSDSI